MEYNGSIFLEKKKHKREYIVIFLPIKSVNGEFVENSLRDKKKSRKQPIKLCNNILVFFVFEILFYISILIWVNLIKILMILIPFCFCACDVGKLFLLDFLFKLTIAPILLNQFYSLVRKS